MGLKEVGYRLVVEGWGQFQSRMTAANASASGFGTALKNAAPALRTIGFAAIGVAAGVGFASIKLAANFENSMRQVNSMMLLSEDAFQQLSGQTRQVARDVGKAPDEMAQALYQVISAGVPAGDAMEFLGVSARAAIAGITDTETAVDGLTNVINAYKMPMSEATRVSDVMFKTVALGKTTFPELAAAMSIAAPSAANLGISFEELMGSVATITKSGVPTSEAMTQIRSAFKALQSPSKEMTGLLDKMGFASGSAALETLGLQGTLTGLREAADDNDQVLTEAFGRIEGYNAMLNLTGMNAATAASDLDSMTTATGAAQLAFEEMEKSASRKFETMMAKLKDLGITIGEAILPAVSELGDRFAPMLQGMADWISAHPDWTVKIIEATAIVGGLALVLGTLPTVIGGAIAILSLLGVVAKLALGPVGLILIALSAVLAASYLSGKEAAKQVADAQAQLDAGQISALEYGNIAAQQMVPLLPDGGSMVGAMRPPELMLPGKFLGPSDGSGDTYNITENYARPEQPQSLEMSLRALEMLVRQ